MAIEYEKPQPLMVGNKAFYTLSSYDPVSVRVVVPMVTDDDVDYALTTLLGQLGVSREKLNDKQWFSQQFPDLTSPDELLDEIRAELTETSMHYAREQMIDACREELAKRLVQAVPPAHLAEAKEAARFSFEQSLVADGISIEQFLRQTGATRAQVELMLEDRAREASEEAAALDAYAREKKLSVQESELAGLFQISEETLKNMMNEARAAGESDAIMDGALRIKALATVVSECSCDYHHESPEEAQARVAEANRLRSHFENALQDDDEDDEKGFELV